MEPLPPTTQTQEIQRPKPSVRGRIALAYSGRVATLLVNVATKIVTLPVMLARLTTGEYAAWVVSVEALNYLTLSRLGIPLAQSRSLSQSSGDAKSREEQLSSYLALNFVCATLSLLLTAALYLLLRHALGLPAAAEIALWLGALSSLALPFSLYASYLQAAFWEAGVEIAATAAVLVHAACVLTLLPLGLGIQGLVVAHGLSQLAQAVVLRSLFRRVHGTFHFSWSAVRWAPIRKLIPFSSEILLSTVSILVFTATDRIVLGTFLGDAEVTRYDLAGKMLAVSLPIVYAVPGVFFPLIARSDGNLAAQRGLYLSLLEGTLAVAGWIAALYLFLGGPLLRAWTARATVDFPIDLAVVFAALFLLQSAMQAGAVFLQAKDEFRGAARLSLLGAISNITISLLLVRSWGATGVVVGSLAAMLIGNGRHIPLFLRRRMEIPWSRYASIALRRVALPLAFSGGVCVWLDPWSYPRAAVVGLALALSLAYGALSWMLLERSLRGRILNWLRERLWGESL